MTKNQPVTGFISLCEIIYCRNKETVQLTLFSGSSENNVLFSSSMGPTHIAEAFLHICPLGIPHHPMQQRNSCAKTHLNMVL